MKSFEVLRESVGRAGAKSVASDMNLSTSLIYKWCEEKENGSGGADNPLDRIAAICELTDDTAPVRWLCEQAGGFFVQNPAAARDDSLPVLTAIRKILQEFSEVLDVASSSYENDGRIDSVDAKQIRKEWEDLKQEAETFVVACENGVYQKEEESE